MFGRLSRNGGFSTSMLVVKRVLLWLIGLLAASLIVGGLEGTKGLGRSGLIHGDVYSLAK